MHRSALRRRRWGFCRWLLACPHLMPTAQRPAITTTTAPVRSSIGLHGVEWHCASLPAVVPARHPILIPTEPALYTLWPDAWFYDVPEICDGGPCESAADALRTAVRHVRRRAIEQRQEYDDITRAYQELRA